MTTPSQASTAQTDLLAVLHAALAQATPAESTTPARGIQPLPRSEMADAISTLQTQLETLFKSVLLMDPMVSTSVSRLQQLAAGIQRDVGECLDKQGSVIEALNLILSALHASDEAGVSAQALIRLIEPLREQLETINTDLVLLT